MTSNKEVNWSKIKPVKAISANSVDWSTKKPVAAETSLTPQVEKEKGIWNTIKDHAFTVNEAIGERVFMNIPNKVSGYMDDERKRIDEELKRRANPEVEAVPEPTGEDIGEFYSNATDPSRQPQTPKKTGFEDYSQEQLDSHRRYITEMKPYEAQEYYHKENPTTYFISGLITRMVAEGMLTAVGARQLQEMAKVPGHAQKIKNAYELYSKGEKIAARAAIDGLSVGTESAILAPEGEKVDEFVKNASLGTVTSAGVRGITEIPIVSTFTGLKNSTVQAAKKNYNKIVEALPFIESSSSFMKKMKTFVDNTVGLSSEGFNIIKNTKKMVSANSVLNKIKKTMTAKYKETGVWDDNLKLFLDDAATRIKANSTKDGKIPLANVHQLLRKVRKSAVYDHPVYGSDKQFSEAVKETARVIDKDYLKTVLGYKKLMKQSKDNMDIIAEFETRFKNKDKVLRTIKAMSRLETKADMKVNNYDIEALKKLDKIFDGEITENVMNNIHKADLLQPRPKVMNSLRNSSVMSMGGFAIGNLFNEGGTLATVAGVGTFLQQQLGRGTGRTIIKLTSKLDDIISHMPNNMKTIARDNLMGSKSGVIKHNMMYKNNIKYRDSINNAIAQEKRAADLKARQKDSPFITEALQKSKDVQSDVR